MNVVVTGRAAGKTHACLAWLAEDPVHRAVVVLHAQEAARLVATARLRFPEAGIGPQNFVGYREALGGVFRGKNVELAVDNADVILRELFGGVTAATLSGGVVAPTDLCRAPLAPPGPPRSDSYFAPLPPSRRRFP